MKALIFDCDGTLVDSELLGNQVLADYAGQFGVELTGKQAARLFRGQKMAESVAYLQAMTKQELPSDFVAEFRRRAAQAFRERLRPVSGALELVRALTIPFCVASNGPRDKMELCLSLTGLLPFFTGRIFSAYDVGYWKPDPGLFLHAAREMGVEPRDCLVVEDSLPGIKGGLAAGMQVLALQREHEEEDLPEGVRVVADLAQVGEMLGLDRG